DVVTAVAGEGIVAVKPEDGFSRAGASDRIVAAGALDGASSTMDDSCCSVIPICGLGLDLAGCTDSRVLRYPGLGGSSIDAVFAGAAIVRIESILVELVAQRRPELRVGPEVSVRKVDAVDAALGQVEVLDDNCPAAFFVERPDDFRHAVDDHGL